MNKGQFSVLPEHSSSHSSIPHVPDSAVGSVPTYKPLPVVTLVPHRTWKSCYITCSCVDWQSLHGHTKVVVGYSDGKLAERLQKGCRKDFRAGGSGSQQIATVTCTVFQNQLQIKKGKRDNLGTISVLLLLSICNKCTAKVSHIFWLKMPMLWNRMFENLMCCYRISLVIRWSFFLPKQSQRSRSVL